jgi:hypothetical protein
VFNALVKHGANLLGLLDIFLKALRRAYPTLAELVSGITVINGAELPPSAVKLLKLGCQLG